MRISKADHLAMLRYRYALQGVEVTVLDPAAPLMRVTERTTMGDRPVPPADPVADDLIIRCYRLLGDVDREASGLSGATLAELDDLLPLLRTAAEAARVRRKARIDRRREADDG